MNDDWLTPDGIVFLAQKVMGGIALDPCARVGSFVSVSVGTEFFPSEVDGLAQSWKEFPTILVNPPRGKVQPYGHQLHHWLRKIRDSARQGCEIIAILPAPTNGPTWWRTMVYPSATALCFLPRDDTAHDIVVGYWGPHSDEFREMFGRIGHMVSLREPDALWRVKVSDYMARRLGRAGVRPERAEERLSHALRSVRTELDQVEATREVLIREAMVHSGLSVREVSRLSGVPLATLSRNYSKERDDAQTH